MRRSAPPLLLECFLHDTAGTGFFHKSRHFFKRIIPVTERSENHRQVDAGNHGGVAERKQFDGNV